MTKTTTTTSMQYEWHDGEKDKNKNKINEGDNDGGVVVGGVAPKDATTTQTKTTSGKKSKSLSIEKQRRRRRGGGGQRQLQEDQTQRQSQKTTQKLQPQPQQRQTQMQTHHEAQPITHQSRNDVQTQPQSQHQPDTQVQVQAQATPRQRQIRHPPSSIRSNKSTPSPSNLIKASNIVIDENDRHNKYVADDDDNTTTTNSNNSRSGRAGNNGERGIAEAHSAHVESVVDKDDGIHSVTSNSVFHFFPNYAGGTGGGGKGGGVGSGHGVHDEGDDDDEHDADDTTVGGGTVNTYETGGSTTLRLHQLHHVVGTGGSISSGGAAASTVGGGVSSGMPSSAFVLGPVPEQRRRRNGGGGGIHGGGSGSVSASSAASISAHDDGSLSLHSGMISVMTPVMVRSTLSSKKGGGRGGGQAHGNEGKFFDDDEESPSCSSLRQAPRQHVQHGGVRMSSMTNSKLSQRKTTSHHRWVEEDRFSGNVLSNIRYPEDEVDDEVGMSKKRSDEESKCDSTEKGNGVEDSGCETAFNAAVDVIGSSCHISGHGEDSSSSKNGLVQAAAAMSCAAVAGGLLVGPVGVIIGAATVGLTALYTHLPEEERNKIETQTRDGMKKTIHMGHSMSEKLSTSCITAFDNTQKHGSPCPAGVLLADSCSDESILPGSAGAGSSGAASASSFDSQGSGGGVGSGGRQRGADGRNGGGKNGLRGRRSRVGEEGLLSSPERNMMSRKEGRKAKIVPVRQIYSLDPSLQPRAWLDVMSSEFTTEAEKNEAMEEILIFAKDKNHGRMFLEEGILDALLVILRHFYEQYTLLRYYKNQQAQGLSAGPPKKGGVLGQWSEEDEKILKNLCNDVTILHKHANRAANCCIALGKAHCAKVHTEGDLLLMSAYNRGNVPEGRQLAQMLHEVPHHTTISTSSNNTTNTAVDGNHSRIQDSDDDESLLINNNNNNNNNKSGGLMDSGGEVRKEKWVLTELSLQQAEELAKYIKDLTEGKMDPMTTL